MIDRGKVGHRGGSLRKVSLPDTAFPKTNVSLTRKNLQIQPVIAFFLSILRLLIEQTILEIECKETFCPSGKSPSSMYIYAM